MDFLSEKVSGTYPSIPQKSNQTTDGFPKIESIRYLINIDQKKLLPAFISRNESRLMR